MKDSWVTYTDLGFPPIEFNGIRTLIFIDSNRVIAANALCCVTLLLTACTCRLLWKRGQLTDYI